MTAAASNEPASDQWQNSFVKAKVQIEAQVEHAPASEDIPYDCISMQKTFLDRSQHEQVPTEEELTELLQAIGKYKKEDELNCGACGYSTCRAKATAVFQKKAELGMCLPYAIAQAESMSNIVLDVTPNLIFIIDDEMRIRECNRMAQAISESAGKKRWSDTYSSLSRRKISRWCLKRNSLL